MRKYRTWHKVLVEQLADREEALDYLQFALEKYQADGDMPFFLRALRTVIEAQGEIAQLAMKTGITPESLSKILYSEDALQIGTIEVILNAFGWRLSIEPLKHVEPNLGHQSREGTRLNTAAETDSTQLVESSSSNVDG